MIYVNDNYGDWNSSAEELAERALEGRHPELVEPVLLPQGSSVRHPDVVVPRDAVAHIHESLAQAALDMMQRNMRVELANAAGCFAASPGSGLS